MSATDRSSPQDLLAAAIRSNDTDAVRQTLAQHPVLGTAINDPLPGLDFGAPPILGAVGQGNRAMIAALLDAGADVNARSRWWAGSFGVLDSADPELVPFLIERGAHVDVHAAARLGMLDRLRDLVSADPNAVHARGGDGQTPLHFAATAEIATFLLDRGAQIDALDIDHESTPAQWMIRDRQKVVRLLIARGCRTDILMAAALGDIERVTARLDADPASIRTEVSDRYFPKKNPRAGGSIYIWTLGADKTAHHVARDFGHSELFALLMKRSPAALALAVACELGDEPMMQSLSADHPAIPEEDRARVVAAAFANNATGVRLLLEAGWPSDVSRTGGDTALHWAGWHGNLEMTRDLLRHGAPVAASDREHHATPIGWAIHGSVHGWHPDRGDYPATIDALIDAGSAFPSTAGSVDATDAVRAVLQRRANQGVR
jgi:ankyrin repeat protein